ncbi:MAG TPA: lysophospholipid acyltransferase family protein [Thermohalobaculum sp.]|nr:lysophospholipid acyltransferase family protein [Thermohalobaculum sp.]
MPHRAAPREISYCSSARSRPGKFLIRALENLTGRPRLLRMADGYETEMAGGRSFWEVMQERYRIEMDLVGAGLANIPAEGPLVLVANHPYGILDGLALGHILSAARSDFRIIAHSVFRKAPELEDIILPVDFSGTREARAVNVRTRRDALAYLAQGGAIGVFPAGTVSTAAKPFSRPMDTVWKPFTARMIARSGARVVPVHFDGHNSRLFQVASHLNYTLRMALMISEFDSRVGGPLRIRIGEPLPEREIVRRAGDPQALMEWLRARTYALGPRPDADLSHGLYLG